LTHLLVISFFFKIPSKESKEENFNFVCPSLPGFGFSDAPKEVGFDVKKIALTFIKLMKKLGYQNYIVQGGDWGSFIATIMARNDKENCKAVHINFAAPNPPQKNIFQLIKTGLTYLFPSLFLTKQEIELLSRGYNNILSGTGYFVLQSTKPQTVGYALNGLEKFTKSCFLDSPVGLASYILEKFHGWSENYKKIDQNLILDNIMIYWVTQTITSSMRTYYEFVHVYGLRNSEDFIDQPTGYVAFPYDLSISPKSWLSQKYNLIRYTIEPNGGHFASLEEPAAFLKDLRGFIQDLKTIQNKNEL
jgi:microsomal epoxide hydrolase